ncbi:hypothetical protein HaLaN_29831 [Haematococcus lacustris]|uniref:Uncharacterized protein n=1 Tax=Haematococcus lacustris TaxID=44745 RepID=A0A6A0AGC2_HAELA|nr:hypothetical protein HaLaN_29831 [Haematococcus lacustris]
MQLKVTLQPCVTCWGAPCRPPAKISTHPELSQEGMPTSEYHLYKRQGCQAARCACCVKSTPAASTGWVEVHVEGEAVADERLAERAWPAEA